MAGKHHNLKGLSWILLPVLLLVAGTLLPGDERQPNRLERIQAQGHLTLLTRNGASSYFLDAQGATGPEYDLARAFADHLGVALVVEVADSFSDLSVDLIKGRGDFIGANLSRTPERERQFRLGPDYAESTTEVVIHRRLATPTALGDLVGMRLAVIAGSTYESSLREAAKTHPDLAWETWTDAGIEDLLLAIDQGELDATLVDSNILALNQPYYPDVQRAFGLDDRRPHTWAFVRDDDDSLVVAAEAFMRVAHESGRLAAIQQRYAPADRDTLDHYSMRHFMRQVRERLPDYLDTFQAVGDAHELDWRLLAAMGFQESHWDRTAASPTGVRGLMMLTRNTANQLGLDDRLDPQQSILGGAQYLLRMRDKLPERIAEPDRTWLALAAYNIGFGHLEDARVLTQRRGGNPDKWADVSRNLPLLTQEKWYRQTRFGYARGHEAQQYVRNIRRYYELLTWLDTREHPLIAQATLAP